MAKYFKGSDSPLSNFYPCDIIFNDQSYRSSEHAYQVAKAQLCRPSAADYIRDAPSAKVAMHRARTCIPNPSREWNDVKVTTMRSILYQKYTQVPDYVTALQTHSAFVEDTAHPFWGRGVDGQGLNHLGRLHSLIKTNPPTQTDVLLVGCEIANDLRPYLQDLHKDRPIDTIITPGATTRLTLNILQSKSLRQYACIYIIAGNHDHHHQREASHTIADLQHIRDHLTSNTKATVVMCGMFPRIHTPTWTLQKTPSEYFKYIKYITRRAQLTDVNKARINDSEYYQPDGYMLNVKGCKVVSRMLYNEMSSK